MFCEINMSKEGTFLSAGMLLEVNMSWILFSSCMQRKQPCDFSQESVRSERSLREEGRGRGQFCYSESKSQQLLLLACVVFLCVKGGSCPFELFRRYDNGWMLRTYVGRPLRLMEEELHAGPLSLRKYKAVPFTPHPSVNECVNGRMPL